MRWTVLYPKTTKVEEWYEHGSIAAVLAEAIEGWLDSPAIYWA